MLIALGVIISLVEFAWIFGYIIYLVVRPVAKFFIKIHKKRTDYEKYKRKHYGKAHAKRRERAIALLQAPRKPKTR